MNEGSGGGGHKISDIMTKHWDYLEIRFHDNLTARGWVFGGSCMLLNPFSDFPLIPKCSPKRRNSSNKRVTSSFIISPIKLIA